MIADILSWSLIVAIPGPDIIAIGSRSARFGHRAGLATAAGAAVGVAIWSALSLLGISALLVAVPTLATILPAVGSLVLILLGLSSVVSASRSKTDGSEVSDGEVEGELRNLSRGVKDTLYYSFRLGLLTNLFNPKALVFFTSFFTPLMSHYNGTAAKALMLGILLVITFVIFSAMSFVIRGATAIPGAKVSVVRFLPGVIFIIVGTYYLVDTFIR